jgi:NADH-quinone oxidoreductase subunit N
MLLTNLILNSSVLLPLSELISKNALTYAEQILICLLPEVTLTLVISYVLTILAIELGKGRAKKDLAFDSIYALQDGLAYVAILYTIQLILGDTEALFNGYLLTSTYVITLKLLTVISGRFILDSSELYMENHSRHLLEYPLVLTLAILFMLLLVGAGHLISAFLALVGFSLNLYVLILFDAPTAVAREAGVKYFYLSTFSSGLILYGVFLMFFVLGTGHFREIGQLLATTPELLENGQHLLQYAILFLLIGLFFKLSAFPGHL